MSIEKGDATKYVHTGNGELCYELNKALTVPETFPIYLSSAYIFDSIDPIDKICDEGRSRLCLLPSGQSQCRRHLSDPGRR